MNVPIIQKLGLGCKNILQGVPRARAGRALLATLPEPVVSALLGDNP